jgi:hypothetical protein
MKASRGFFLLALCSGMGAAIHGQTLPHGAVLLGGEPVSGDIALFPPQAPPLQTSLPDAPIAVPQSDESGAAYASSTSVGSAHEHADAPAQTETWGPLTGRARLTLFWNDTYNSLGAFAALSLSAAAGEIENKPARWSADGSGYTRHFASAYGQFATRNVIREGLAGASGLDPRHLPCQCKGVVRRSGHALKMSFATLTHSGRMTLDVPQLAGAYGSGMISAYWYPHRLYSPLVQGVQFGHEEMGEVFATNLVQEFTPDLKSVLHLH